MPSEAEEFLAQYEPTKQGEGLSAKGFLSQYEPTEPDLRESLLGGVKPALQLTGALGGTALGVAIPTIGEEPVLAAGGYALGSAAGDLFERAVGLKKPLMSPQEAIRETAETGLDAITQYMFDRIFGKLISGGIAKINAKAAAKKAMLAEKRRLADLAKREAGIQVTRGDISGSKLAKLTETTGAALPPSAKQIEESAVSKLEAYERYVKNTIKKYSPQPDIVRTTDLATTQLETVKATKLAAFKEKVNTFASGFGSKALSQSGDDAVRAGEALSQTFRDEVVNPAYDAVARLRPKGRLRLPKTSQLATRHLQELMHLKNWEKKAISSQFRTLVDTLSDLGLDIGVTADDLIRSGIPKDKVDDVLAQLTKRAEIPEFTVKQVTDKIKYLGNLAAKEDVAFATSSGIKFQGNKAGGIYKNLRTSLTNELDEVVSSSGDDAFISAWQYAKERASEAFQIWDSSVFRLMKKNPEAWAKPGGALFKPYNETVLKKINRAIGDPAYKDLIGAWLREANETPKDFVKVLSSLDDGTLKAIFKNSQERFQVSNLLRSGRATEASVSEISKLVKKYPDAFISNIFRDIREFKTAKRILPIPTIEELKGVWLEKSLGVGKHGFIHPTALSDLLDSLPGRFKQEIFKKSGELARINKIAEIGNLIKDADKVANIASGGTSSLIYFGYTASVLRSILTGDVVGATAQLGVPYLGAKFYLSPTGSKLLLEGLEIKAGTREAAKWLTKVAAVSATGAVKKVKERFSEERKK